MAIGIIFQGAGVTRAQYDQVHDVVTPNNSPPPGAISHVAGFSEDGLVVVEVWESKEAATAFFDDKLGAALAAAGLNVQPTMFEIFNTMP